MHTYIRTYIHIHTYVQVKEDPRVAEYYQLEKEKSAKAAEASSAKGGGDAGGGH